MDNNPLSGILSVIGLGVCILLFLAIRRFFPSFAALLLGAAGVVLLLILALVAFVIFLALKKPKEPKKEAGTMDINAILSKGRTNLMELRSLAVRIRNQQVRAVSIEICETVERILRTLKEQPEHIPSVRQFFNYYLPTLGSILSKYVRMEKSGLPEEEMTKNAISCLNNIRTAMEKQYKNLFDDDVLDLTVEMEALTLACKRDGLLEDENLKLRSNGKDISLTL